MLRSVLSTTKFFSNPTILVADNVLTQQTRNTFILKRKWPPGLTKKNQKPSKLRPKHYVYDLVEDTLNSKKKGNLEVVLTSFVDGIGDKGDVVTVKQNYGYNKLLLPGLAVYKTSDNLQKFSKSEDEKNVKIHSSPFAQRTVNMLSGCTLAVVMNKETPWLIEKWHIKASLRKAGYNVAEETITLPETPISGPDLLKQNKEFYVTVTVNDLEKATVKCRIHHWSTDPSERLPYVLDHWKEVAEPLFGTADTEQNQTEVK